MVVVSRKLVMMLVKVCGYIRVILCLGDVRWLVLVVVL